MSRGAGTITAANLPARFAPMLATSGPPFDSDRHLFEVKWDGIRAVTMVDRHNVRMLSRRGSDLTGNYPASILAAFGFNVLNLGIAAWLIARDRMPPAGEPMLRPA